ncbi:MAG: histidinol-phosphatase HisJ family protein [Ruminococcaceae bacterium]|nr:histidinol-phosphatase HisJ family protein [Oscillospiraceae bacterium]
MTPRCNFHTHTNFCDGKHSAEQMLASAIELGCTALGFSGHSYIDEKNTEWTMSRDGQNDYIREINRLKSAYADKIEVLLGIEQDYFSSAPEYAFDYVIGSVHAVIKDGVRIDVDLAPKTLLDFADKLYGGNMLALIEDYYSLVSDVVNKTNCDIIGHVDLITKFNEKYPFIDVTSRAYRNVSLEAVDALIEKDKIFEINTGAISRGWRKKPYPDDFILKRLAEKNANIMINSDCHSTDSILCFFDEAVEYAKVCGVRELCVYENKKIKKILI